MITPTTGYPGEGMTYVPAGFYGYRTSSGIVRRHVAGDCAPDSVIRLAAIYVIGWGCA